MNDIPIEKMNGLIYDAKDAIMRMTVMGGEASIMMCRTTSMTQKAQDTHLASDAATAAFGRVLSGTAMLSTVLKEDSSSVTVTFQGGGPAGKIICVGNKNTLKITATNPQAEVEPLSSGAQDVPGYIGSDGTLSVVKDFGKGEPYIGISCLKSGEVAEDFAQYYMDSEQVNSIVALGCLNANGVVLSSGGIIIQALPGISEKTLDMLEMRIPFYSNISREIYDRSMEELCRAWFRGMDLQILSHEELYFNCDCSREKMLGALIASGKDELNDIIQKGEDIEMQCWFCRTRRKFTVAEIQELLKK